MVGLWEGVPASPVSGASDETAFRNTSSRRSGKRSRFSRRTDRSDTPESSSVEFVAASDSKDEKDSRVAAKLNATAADERRKMLLNQLRIIDRRKAELKALVNSAGSTSAGSSGETALPLMEAATPEPDEGDTLDSNTRSSRRRKPKLQLDLPKSNNFRSRRADIDRFCSSSTPSAASVYGSPLPSPTSELNGSPSLSYADLPTRRSSRRATRPRTPSVLLNAMPGETVLRMLPIGVLKCKRYCFCKKVISLLFKNPSAAPFSAPVREMWKPEAIPRYFDVITRPMDLGTVKKNMEGVNYLNTQESNPLLMFQPNLFAEDVRQVFRNAKIYNKRGDVLYNCANDLLSEFEQMWVGLPAIPRPGDNRRKRNASGPPRSGSLAKRGRTAEAQLLFGDGTMGKSNKSRSKRSPRSAPAAPAIRTLKITKFDETMNTRQLRRRLDYLRKCRIALRARTPLPKGNTFYDRAALLYDVPLTDGEKSEIAKGIKRLNSNKLSTFLGIIGDAAPKDEEGEVELDILSFDTKTLRNVEAYLETALSNFKNIRNSQIGSEFISVEEFEAEEKLIEQRLLANSKSPRQNRKEELVSDDTPTPTYDSTEKQTQELYASSDSDSGDSDSDSDGSDSDSD